MSIPIFQQETQRLIAEPVPGISAVPDENNARYFHVVVAGPAEVTYIYRIFLSYLHFQFLVQSLEVNVLIAKKVKIILI